MRVKGILLAVVVLLGMAGAIPGNAACTRDTRDFPALTGMVPASVNHFAYWDIETLNKDADLWGIFGRFKESSDARQMGELISVLASIKQAARAYSYDNASLSAHATIFKGSFDAPYMKGEMESLGYAKASEEGLELWLPPDNYTYPRDLALKDGTVYVGQAADIAACIQAASGKNALSLHSDPNIRLVSDKLPGGVVVELHREGVSVGEYYPDLVVYGKSYGKSNRDTLNVTAVYMFGDDPAARGAQQAIQDYSATMYQNVNVKREGNLIILKAQVPIAVFVSTLLF